MKILDWLRDLLDSQLFITYALIITGSLVGSMSQFFRDGKPFSFGQYLFEVFSSLLAGFLVYVFLSSLDVPQGYISALSGLAAYFGTKFLTQVFDLFTGVAKRRTGVDK